MEDDVEVLRAELVEFFIDDHADVAARLLEQSDPGDLARWLPELPIRQASLIFERTLPVYAGRLLDTLPISYLVAVLAGISATTLAALMRSCNPVRQRELLAAMATAHSTQIRMLLNFAEDSIGYWMHADVFVLPSDISVGEAIMRLRSEPGQMETESLLVMDRDRMLRGSLYVAALLRAQEDVPIAEILRPISYAVPGRMSLQGVQHHEGWQELQWLPVINRSRQFIGILRHVDLHRGLEQLNQSLAKHVDAARGTELISVYGETLLRLGGTLAEMVLAREGRGR